MTHPAQLAGVTMSERNNIVGQEFNNEVLAITADRYLFAE
jgi:hypothetical protein